MSLMMSSCCTFPLEAAERAFNGLAFLNLYCCARPNTPFPVGFVGLSALFRLRPNKVG